MQRPAGAANSTDLVLFNYVLHHAADDTAAAEGGAAAVKPDGRVVVEDLRADDAAGLRHQDLEHSGARGAASSAPTMSGAHLPAARLPRRIHRGAAARLHPALPG